MYVHVGLPRMQRIILRLVDALIAMDSRPVIQAENMVTMSNSEELKMDLNGVITELNDFQLLLSALFSSR